MKQWRMTANGDQEEWQDFCEEFMGEDIVIIRRWVKNEIVVTCQMPMDPNEPIDSTGSMPSFIDQAKSAGFTLQVEEIE